MRKFFRRVGFFFGVVFILLSGILFSLSFYFRNRFSNLSFEQLIYSLLYSKAASFSAIKEGIFFSVVFVFIYLVIFSGVYFLVSKVVEKISKGKIVFCKKVFFVFGFIMFIISFCFFMREVDGFRYFANQFNHSSIFEDYYINPKDVSIRYHGKKKNLIYIYVESLESSNVSVLNGGIIKDSYIPNLELIALDNLNFSNTDKIGGAIQFPGLNWTIAGMVAATSGIPLKVIVERNSYSGYSNFLPGVYSLGEILEEFGYKNYIMMGSYAFFGGRSDYFSQHGNYHIMDYQWAKDEKLIGGFYREWWGFEDSKLFEFSKNKLLEISQNDEAFNYTILTADTHFVDGYIDKSCNDDLPFQSHYANSFYCSDKMIYQFLEWLKKQDFYQDTVVIISGDHLTMQNDFYDANSHYQRTVYNAFLNTDLDDTYSKNRLFTTMDMYPTTLAAMGFSIEGDRLGLGTNLFSGKKTLLEKMGYEEFNNEINKNSYYYNKYLLGDSYFEMYKDHSKDTVTN